MQNKRWMNNLLFALLGTLYCWSVLTVIIRFSYLQFEALPLLVLCGVISCALVLLSYTKRTLAVGSALLALLIGVWLLLGLRNGRTANVFNDLSYIVRMIASVEDYNPLYNAHMVVLVVLLVSTFVCFSFKTTYNFFLLSGFGIAMFCIALNENSPVGLEFYVLLFVLLTLLLARLFVRHSRKKRLTGLSIGQYLLRALPLSLAVVLFASAAALPFENLKQSPLFNYDNWTEFLSSGPFSGLGKTTQFHKGEVQLGGNLTPSDTPVLRVQAEESLYLAGSVNDEYTGHSWKQSRTEYNSYSTDVPTVDAANALRYSGILPAPEVQTQQATITFLSDERTLFVPGKYFGIEGIENNIIYINNTGELETDQQIPSEGSYTVTYQSNRYVSSGQIQELWNLLREYPNDLVPFSSTVFNEQAMSTVRGWDQQLQRAYAENLAQTYTALPASVTQRTRDLAAQLTADQQGPAAQAEAIRDYLIQNYTYSLTPGSPDPDRDFVDQFLFEIQKGYCTSFATAMTVLSRCAGIPARYVEGYAVPGQPEEDGQYLVKSRNAHAWAEVYFDNYGWVKIEATPPYAYADEAGEKPQILLDENAGDELLQNLDDIGIDPPAPDQAPTGEYEPGTEGDPANAERDASSAGTIIWAVCAAVLALVCAAAALRVVQRRRSELSPHSPDAALAQKSFEKIVRLAKFSKLPLQPGETPLSFGRRLAEQGDGIPFERAAACYCAQQYGGAKLSSQEALCIYQTYRQFEALTRSRSGKFRFFLCKYLLHTI